ncbi:MAG: PDZ domain-containing protein, partial [Candidatus Zixiibacteriota bacterium]
VEPRYLGRSMLGDIRNHYIEFLGEHDYQELVVVTGLFSASINKGYGSFVRNTRVLSINGFPIKRLADVSKAFASASGIFYQIELENGGRIILDKAKVDEEEAEIRKRYNIN